ncbi:MAG: tRNA pseudouridine(55) synthase TruB [Erysipelotrichales bacterium]|nr:tRNA pseudouridine(55) synthase TruB [Erysipelotrichales bacterium]
MNGIIILDKAQDITSFKAGHKVKHLLGAEKVGHTGTLDPLATGVLPILVNSATKLADIFMEKNKSYDATGQFGIKTDTGDITGKIIEETFVPEFTKKDLATVIASFIGEYKYLPPMYSAIKQDGKKLYQLARKNITVERQERVSIIHEISLEAYYEKENIKYFSIKVKAEKGLYVRSLIEDIAAKMNTCATMSALRRTASGDFKIAQSYKMEEIENGNYKIISLEELFKDYPKLEVNDYLANLVKNGNILDERQIKTESYFLVYNNKELIAIYQPIKKYQYRPLVML